MSLDNNLTQLNTKYEDSLKKHDQKIDKFTLTIFNYDIHLILAINTVCISILTTAFPLYFLDSTGKKNSKKIFILILIIVLIGEILEDLFTMLQNPKNRADKTDPKLWIKLFIVLILKILVTLLLISPILLSSPLNIRHGIMVSSAISLFIMLFNEIYFLNGGLLNTIISISFTLIIVSFIYFIVLFIHKTQK
jgi:hypothetical protein